MSEQQKSGLRRMTVYLSETDYSELKALTERRGRSVSDIARSGIKKELIKFRKRGVGGAPEYYERGERIT